MPALSLRARSLSVVSLTLFCLAVPAAAQQDLDESPTWSTLYSTSPKNGDQGQALDKKLVMRFSLAIDGSTLSEQSVMVSSGGIPIPTTFSLSLNRKTAIAEFPGFLPAESTIDVAVDGSLVRDEFGRPTDADRDGMRGGVLNFSFMTGVGAPLDTGTAEITGYVFDEKGAPLQGAVIDSVLYPGEEGDPPLPPPPGISDSTGFFMYETIEITGEETFLVRVRNGDDYNEILEVVTIQANGCWRIKDAFIGPVSPKEKVFKDQGATLMDPTGQIILDIPPDALEKDSDIGITILASEDYLRDDLPQLVSEAGLFVDVAGVFGDATNEAVTFTVPNTYNLPKGTRLPFGKIDHNTLEWMDLREAYEGGGDPPDTYLGEVIDDGQGGTVIQIQFDHFCSVCTGYCLPIPCDVPKPNGPPCDPPPGPDPPDPWPWPPLPWVCGNSIITLSEGTLYEWIDLPGFTEFEEPFQLRLGYASHAADPTVTIAMAVDFLSTRPVERTIFRFQVEGHVMEAAYGFTQNDLKPRGIWFWDGTNFLGDELETGSYPTEAQATSLNADVKISVPEVFGGEADFIFDNLFYPGIISQTTAPLIGRATVVNLKDSPYGAGWSVTNEPRLHPDADGCVTMTYGNVGWRRFVPDPNDPQAFLPPDDYSLLVRDPADGTYTRTLLDGSVESYDSVGRIVSGATRTGETTSFVHDNDGKLLSITSPTGFQYLFSYTADKLSQISDSAGRVTAFVVDGNGDLVSSTDPTMATRTFEYGPDHRMTAQNGARGERSEYDFDNTRVVEARAYDTDGTTLLRRRIFEPSALDGEMGAGIADGLGSLLFPIPPTEGHVDVSTDGNGRVSRHYTNDEMRTVRQTDPLDRDVLVGYDSAGNISSRTKPDGARTDATYDAIGNPTSFSEFDEQGGLIGTANMAWGGAFGQLSQTTDELGKVTLYSYDGLGNLQALEDHLGNQTLRVYGDPNFAHLPSQVTLPTGDTTTFTYDVHGNVETETVYPDPINFPNGDTTTFTYDDRGNLTFETDHDGGVLQYVYDDMNRPITTVDQNLKAVTYSYSDAGCSCSTDNVTKVTLPGGATLNYAYDGLGRVTSSTDQDGQMRAYSYDPEGSLLSETRRDGVTIDYTYDDVGRRVRKEDSGGEVTLYGYDAVDRLVFAQDSGCQLDFVYDALGNTTQAMTQLDLPLENVIVHLSHTIDYTYDAAGNRTSMSDDTGLTDYAYAYDDLHRLTNLDLVPMAGTSWALDYDESSRRTTVTPESSGVQSVFSYDMAGRLAVVTHGTTPALFSMYDLYDGVGNIEHVSGQVSTGALDRSYEYEATHRVMQGDFSQVFGDSRENINYLYDAANRLQSDTEFTYTYDLEGRLSTRTPVGGDVTDHFTYDAKGQLVEFRQQWDDNGNDTTILTAAYSYDPLGRRVQKDVNGVVTRYVYDNAELMHEIDKLDRVARHYTQGPGMDDHLAVHNQALDIDYNYHVDRLGSMTALSRGAGNVDHEVVYDEFGNHVAELDPRIHQAYGYTGRQHDLESGLYYYRARYYDPRTGRFLSEDPVQLEGGLNFYTYVENNPTNKIDPTGMISCAPPSGVLVNETLLVQHLQMAGFNASVAFTEVLPSNPMYPPDPIVPIPIVRIGRGKAIPYVTPGQSIRTKTRAMIFQ